MKHCTFFLSLAFFLSYSFLNAQLSDLSAFGRAEVAPTKISGSIGLEKGIGGKHSLLLSSGMSYFKYRNSGEKELEEGWSNTAMLGYRYYLNNRYSGFFGELGAGVALRRYQWADNIAYADAQQGNTTTWTAMPSLRIGYSIEGLNFWDFSPLVGVTYAKHFKTSGQGMMEGFLPSVGIQVNYWFR